MPSHVRLFATPWTAAHQASLHLPEFAQVHGHCIGDAVQPSHPLSPSSPSAFSLSQHHYSCCSSIRWITVFSILTPYLKGRLKETVEDGHVWVASWWTISNLRAKSSCCPALQQMRETTLVFIKKWRSICLMLGFWLFLRFLFFALDVNHFLSLYWVCYNSIASVLCCGFLAPQHVLSSPTRDHTHIPCFGRWSLNHWTAREVLRL